MGVTGTVYPMPRAFAKTLSSGSATLTGTIGSPYQNVGSFSTTADIGNGQIVLDIAMDGDNSDDVSELELSNTSATTGLTLSQNIVNAEKKVRVIINKNPTTSTNTDLLIINKDAATIYQSLNSATFDISTAETFFIVCNVLDTKVTKFTWIAQLITPSLVNLL